MNKMSVQNKLILSGLMVSTVFIMLIAVFATFNIQKKLDDAYENFGRIISKTIAVEAVDLYTYANEDILPDKLKIYSDKILQKNDDIISIDFFSKSGKLIYESPKDNVKSGSLLISSPVITGNSESIGSVTVLLSENVVSKITSTVRASLISVFSIVWLIFAFVLVVNSYLTTKELRILKDGVTKISTGEFGHIITDSDVSSEVKQVFKSFNDMSNRLRIYDEQNIEQLTLEKNKLEAILMNTANGVVVCNVDNKIELLNYQAQKLLNTNEHDLLGTCLLDYCDNNSHKCFENIVSDFKQEKNDFPAKFEFEINDKTIKVLISPMFSKNGEQQGYIVVLIDITKEAEIDKMRGQFISNVSHELRTPVTVLRSYIDTLYNYGEELDEKTKREFLSTLNDEIIRLQNMVNDILDFSRLDSANVKIVKEYGRIQETVESCVKSVEILAKEKQITISISQDENLPNVYMNEESIFRAIKNLLSNAIKYSLENSSILVKTELADKEGYIKVSVKDNGMGISQEDQKKVFDRFYRVENATHTIKGTGLGLHIVKVTIEKHHQGEVFVHSVLSKGSTFGFIIPINPIEQDVTV